MSRQVLELRTFPRASVDVDATLLVSGSPSVPLSVRNLSEGGMLATSPSIVLEGQHVTITITPRGAAALSVPARVVRTKVQRSSVCLLGIEWLSLAPAVRAQIRELVANAEAMAWDAAGAALPQDVARKFVPKIRAHAWVLTRRARLDAHLGVDDLVGSGFLALVETFARAGALPPDEFERLADARIRGAMLDEIRRADTVPRATRRTARDLRSRRRAMQASLQRLPTHEELSEASGLAPRVYQEAASVLTPMPQVYVPPGDSEPSAATPDPEEEALRTQRLAAARQAFDALPPRLREVLTLYYGQELTLREIGNVLGVSEGRISQLLSGALEKLKSAKADD